MQYASSEYVLRLEEAGAKISMAAVGNPYENAKAESFFRTLKMEEVYLKDYQDFEEAQQNIAAVHRGGLQPQEIALQPRVSTSGRIRGATCPEGRKLTMATVRKMGSHQYRKLARTHHPDKVANLEPEVREYSEQRMKEINAAYAEFKRQWND